MNMEEIYRKVRSECTDEEYTVVMETIALTARLCAATACNLCQMNLDETAPGPDIKSIGTAIKPWSNYDHSVEYRDGRQEYWPCGANEIWKALE